MRRLFLPLSVLILLVAAFLRLWALHTYPPGPHYDEAVYLLITRSIAFGGARPFPIVEAYQGREVLYMYLNAPLLHLWGDGIFTLQVSSALLNLLTIAASIGLGRAMFSGLRGVLAGLIIGLMMALSFPHIWLARQAFRAVTLPFCQALALYFLWRGLIARKRAWLLLAAGGLFAGLALYTYMASRLFPLWLALGGVALLVMDQARRGLRLRQGLIFFGVLCVVALPMAVYAVQKPDIFLGRLEEVTQPERSVSLGQSILLHARMFFIEGDPYLRYNIPGRPYFSPIEGVFLLVGLAVAAARLLRPGPAVERAACALGLLAPLMTIPSVISVGGFPPSHMRSLGMTPLIFVVTALGAATVIEWLAARWRPRRVYRLVMAAMPPVLLAGALAVGSEYFSWAGRADVFYETDADLAVAARWARTEIDDETLIYVAARDRGHPTFMIDGPPGVTWLGTDSLFRPPPGVTGLAIFPRSAPPASWLPWLESRRIEGLPLGPDGRTAFEAFRLSGDMALPEFEFSPDGRVANRFLSWIGTQTEPIVAGTSGDVISAWVVLAPPDASDLTPILQLEDEQGAVIARSDSYMTETDRWRSGEVLMQRTSLFVPHGTPPGDYLLRATWVAKASDRYVPFEAGGVWETIGRVVVEKPANFPDPSVLPVEIEAGQDVAPGIRLLGWNAVPASARPGETLSLTLYWQALPSVAARAALALEIYLERDGMTWPLYSGGPVGDTYGAENWSDGELVVARERARLPRTLDAGDYRLMLAVGRSEVELGQLRIEGQPRQFDPPAVQTISGARFGDVIALYGFDLAAADGQIDLRLVWQSLQATDEDYTVFVHVLNAQGEIVAQRDMFPGAGAYPTSLWLEGEYVHDEYHFDGLDPNGMYTILAGLYLQDTGQRLSVDSQSFIILDTIIFS